ncbi:MAG: hypothetical protein ACT6QU_14715 [Aliihoeflea sp.]|uniref:hypothetical protein n=1 Tax=Aliihoeflea sp. TaxID=2608088 RepID=UPI0040332D7F
MAQAILPDHPPRIWMGLCQPLVAYQSVQAAGHRDSGSLGGIEGLHVSRHPDPVSFDRDPDKSEKLVAETVGTDPSYDPIL